MLSGESKREHWEQNGSGKIFLAFTAARKFKSPAKALVLQRERCLPLDFGRYCVALLRCLHFSFRILCFFQATEKLSTEMTEVICQEIVFDKFDYNSLGIFPKKNLQFSRRKKPFTRSS